MDKALLRISHASQILAVAALAAGIAAAFSAMAGQPASRAMRVGPEQVRLDIALPKAAACGRIVSVGSADPGTILVEVDLAAFCASPGEAGIAARMVDVPAGLDRLRFTMRAVDGTVLDERRLVIN